MLIIEKVAALGSGIKQLKDSLASLNKYQKADAMKFLGTKKTTINIVKMKKGGMVY